MDLGLGDFVCVLFFSSFFSFPFLISSPSSFLLSLNPFFFNASDARIVLFFSFTAAKRTIFTLSTRTLAESGFQWDNTCLIWAFLGHLKRRDRKSVV